MLQYKNIFKLRLKPTHPVFTCSKLTLETVEKGVNNVTDVALVSLLLTLKKFLKHMKDILKHILKHIFALFSLLTMNN